MGPTWVLSAPDGPHVGPMNLAIRDGIDAQQHTWVYLIASSARLQTVTHHFGTIPAVSLNFTVRPVVLAFCGESTVYYSDVT